MQHVDPIQRLILAFSRLPSVGEKTAARFTFYLLNRDQEVTEELSSALKALHTAVQFCSICAHLSAQDPCRYCNSDKRDHTQICVVEDVSALMAIEKTGEYRGRYHVLHGVISPFEGIGPDDLKIAELIRRLQVLTQTTDLGEVEIIIATNPSVDGEATSLYLSELLKPLGVSVSRIASGVPMGSNLQYADQLSLAQALMSRRKI
jgi:recombination protein RecR